MNLIMMKNSTLILIFISQIILAGCNDEDSEVRRLGFTDKKEMFDIQLKGYENKQKYEEMLKREELRGKPLREMNK